MAVVIICSDFGYLKNKICHFLYFFSFIFPWSDGTRWHKLSFLNVEFQATLLTLIFTIIKRLFSSSLLSAIRVVLSAYLRWLIFLLAGLIPAYKTPVTNLAMFNSYINSFHSEVPGVEVAAHGNRFSTTSGTYWMRNSMGGTQEFISSPDDADAGSNLKITLRTSIFNMQGLSPPVGLMNKILGRYMGNYFFLDILSFSVMFFLIFFS